ncbi:MAG: T9SS type A sorting domain-containing protein [Bacteroidetes bacterium]|nr:T9SS type A sorting domain-containing protein [Bacteroidota bacterium]
MKQCLLIILIFTTCNVHSQNRNSVWCFGDSAGIDFSSGTGVPILSGMDGRGSCASIADTNGNLLFYANTRSANGNYSALVFDSTHSVMLNGDSIFGQGWYQEVVIVPNPANDSTYYLFSIGVASGSFGLYYSIVDMRLNAGLGAVTTKNVQLQSFAMVDCINAVKHGNGRDWWLIFRKSEFPNSSNNDWYSYLITPTGIQNFSIQSIGVQNRTNLGHISFSPNADKMVFCSLQDVIELFDFDRCTGVLSNPITIQDDPGMIPSKYTWSCEFSPDASKLYVSTNLDTSYLFQYDLNAANISATKDTLWELKNIPSACGALKLAPDNKIYLSNWYYDFFNNPYPYQDSVFNTYNMNLSVINQPDSLGTVCDFQPYSFYLGGKRTYLGLPNNPDYDMPALAGSPCDTLAGINEAIIQTQQSTLNVYYSPNWQTAFINADKLKGNNCKLQVFDAVGKMVFEEQSKIQPPYYTKNLNCINFKKGVYLVVLQTDVERLVKKFVVE